MGNMHMQRGGALLLALAVSGCVDNGNIADSNLVRLESNPPGARVETSHPHMGSPGDVNCDAGTPCSIWMQRDIGFHVTFKKDGCEDRTVYNTSRRGSPESGAFEFLVNPFNMFGSTFNKELTHRIIPVDLDCG